MLSTNDNDEPDAANQSWLATQLRQAKAMRLRKQQEKQEGAPSGGGVHAVASAGTLSRAQGADMMSDLQRVLAARRRAREGDVNVRLLFIHAS